MSLQQLLSQFGGGGGGPGGGAAAEVAVADTAETIQISSMALLKMLKHGRLGIPMEVMGLMLGEFVDEYTVTCIDVFAMPQHGTGVSVEAVDPVFQTTMLDMLKQCGRPEMVVGWYHSHRKSINVENQSKNVYIANNKRKQSLAFLSICCLIHFVLLQKNEYSFVFIFDHFSKLTFTIILCLLFFCCIYINSWFWYMDVWC